MLECSSTSECRGGYVCLTIGDDPWGATVLEGRSVGGVCVPNPPEQASGESGYCSAGLDTRPNLADLVSPIEAGFGEVPVTAGSDAGAESDAGPALDAGQ